MKFFKSLKVNFLGDNVETGEATTANGKLVEHVVVGGTTYTRLFSEIDELTTGVDNLNSEEPDHIFTKEVGLSGAMGNITVSRVQKTGDISIVSWNCSNSGLLTITFSAADAKTYTGVISIVAISTGKAIENGQLTEKEVVKYIDIPYTFTVVVENIKATIFYFNSQGELSAIEQRVHEYVSQHWGSAQNVHEFFGNGTVELAAIIYKNAFGNYGNDCIFLVGEGFTQEFLEEVKGDLYGNITFWINDILPSVVDEYMDQPIVFGTDLMQRIVTFCENIPPLGYGNGNFIFLGVREEQGGVQLPQDIINTIQQASGLTYDGSMNPTSYLTSNSDTEGITNFMSEVISRYFPNDIVIFAMTGDLAIAAGAFLKENGFNGTSELLQDCFLLYCIDNGEFYPKIVSDIQSQAVGYGILGIGYESLNDSIFENIAISTVDNDFPNWVIENCGQDPEERYVAFSDPAPVFVRELY